MRPTRLAWLVVALALGCGEADPDPATPTADVRWTGESPGGFTAPGSATWCADAGALLLVAVSNDTGVSVLVRPDSTGLGASYAIGAAGDSVPPGGGLVGLRLYGDRTVSGYRSVDGTVGVSERPAGLEATLDATLVEPTLGDTLRVTGRIAAPPADTEATCAGPAPAG